MQRFLVWTPSLILAFCVVTAAQAPLTVDDFPKLMKANAQAAGRDNMVFLRGSAGTLLPAIAEPVSAVILDPPRTGADEPALRAIIDRGIPRVVYVSCDVATLARDARHLVDAGYMLASVEAFDLFPDTAHVETLAVFAR